MNFINHSSRFLHTCKSSFKNLLAPTYLNPATCIITRSCKTEAEKGDDADEAINKERATLSKAMKAFVAKINSYETSMVAKEEEFEIGRRHLANMMGISLDKFAQIDIDKSIEYLFPSGLFNKGSRPYMNPPREIYPKVDKTPKFNDEGRPYDTLFYTGKPKYYRFLQEIGEEQIRLDGILSKGEVDMTEDHRLPLHGTEWVSEKVTEHFFNENIRGADYTVLLSGLASLAEHPLSGLSKKLIMTLRKPVSAEMTRQLATVMMDEDGRYFAVDTGKKKKVKVTVKVIMNGTGKFVINDDASILFFEEETHRSAVLFPLFFTNMAMKVDVYAYIEKELDLHTLRMQPNSYQHFCGVYAMAIRLGLARALLPFVEDETRERMRVAGLLTVDIRGKERKKTGQPGARKKKTWRAR